MTRKLLSLIAACALIALLPNVRTLAEQGIARVESNNWYGLVAPSTPEALAALIRSDAAKWARIIPERKIKPE